MAYTDVREQYTCGACGSSASRIVRKWDDGARAIEREIPHKRFGEATRCDGIIPVRISARDLSSIELPVTKPDKTRPEDTYPYGPWD